MKISDMESGTEMFKPGVNRFKDRFRHELKYFIGVISEWEYMDLADELSRTMRRDPNCRGGKDYWIRSLYFDTPEKDDYFEKLAGISRRKKIRLRIYDTEQQTAKIEIKNKCDQYIYKESTTISREDAEALINGNTEVLHKPHLEDPTLNNAYYHMLRDFYRPAVMVDYEREAYIGPSEDMRITFDKNIRGSGTEFDLYSSALHLAPAFNDPYTVIEVKYQYFLPEFIKRLLNRRVSERFAISKYYYSRVTQYR
jgi:hypothetical protein